ncbi:MAG: hypothetical protein EPN20_14200, partial [Magnetospirillum sp.]
MTVPPPDNLPPPDLRFEKSIDLLDAQIKRQQRKTIAIFATSIFLIIMVVLFLAIEFSTSQGKVSLYITSLTGEKDVDKFYVDKLISKISPSIIGMETNRRAAANYTAWTKALHSAKNLMNEGNKNIGPDSNIWAAFNITFDSEQPSSRNSNRIFNIDNYQSGKRLTITAYNMLSDYPSFQSKQIADIPFPANNETPYGDIGAALRQMPPDENRRVIDASLNALDGMLATASDAISKINDDTKKYDEAASAEISKGFSDKAPDTFTFVRQIIFALTLYTIVAMSLRSVSNELRALNRLSELRAM